MKIARITEHYSRPVRELEKKLVKEGHMLDRSLVYHGPMGKNGDESICEFIDNRLQPDAENIILIKDRSLRLHAGIRGKLRDIIDVESVLPPNKKIKVFALAGNNTHVHRRINELSSIDYQTDNIHSLAPKLNMLREATKDGSFFRVLSNLIRDAGCPQLSDVHLIADRCFIGHIPDNIFHGYTYTRFTDEDTEGSKLKIICVVPVLNEAVMEKAKSIASALNIEDVDDAIINCQQEVFHEPKFGYQLQGYYDRVYEQILDKAGIIDSLTHFIIDAEVYKYIGRHINNDRILHVVI